MSSTASRDKSKGPKVVQKVIRVPTDDAEWFEETYPIYGAWTWFVQTALSNFRALHEDSPGSILKDAVSTLAVQQALEERGDYED